MPSFATYVSPRLPPVGKPHKQDCAHVLDYPGIDLNGNNESSGSLQTALGEAYTAGKELFSPAGTIVLDPSSLDPIHNGMVVLPQNGNQNAARTVKFRGAMPSFTSENGIPPVGATIIKVIKPNGQMGGVLPSMFSAKQFSASGTLQSFNYIVPDFSNLYFQMPPDSKLSAMNFHNAIGCVMNFLGGSPEATYQNVAEPTNPGQFFAHLPGINNHAQVLVNYCSIYGFHNGFSFSEHAHFNRVLASRCKIGMICEGGNHTSFGSLMGFEQCARAFRFDARAICRFNVSFESNSEATWYGQGIHIDGNASFNYPRGIFEFNHVVANNADNLTVPLNNLGVANLKFIDLRNPNA